MIGVTWVDVLLVALVAVYTALGAKRGWGGLVVGVGGVLLLRPLLVVGARGPAVALVRMIESSLPAWQLWASLGISLVCLAGSVWLVARLFRAAMLMYGQAIKPQQIIQALRQA